MNWDCIAYDKLVVQCNRNIQAMQWNEIAYNKRSCAMHWEALLMISRNI